MSKKRIITNLEVLSERADEIDCLKENAIVRETTLNLKQTIQDNNLTYLTAPQIGVKKRIMCINFNGDIRTFVNPVIGAVNGFVLSREDCASIPKKEFILPRNSEIQIVYQMPTGKVQSNKLKGKAAAIAQAAVQALDGLYICDVGLPLVDGWDELPEEDKDKIISDYLTSLDFKQKQVEKEIKEDKELNDIKEASEFLASVASGKTKLEKVDG